MSKGNPDHHKAKSSSSDSSDLAKNSSSSSKKNNPAAANYKSVFKTEKVFYLADRLFKDEEVSKKIQDIIFRDLERINQIDDAFNKQNSDININTVKVSLVFYKKNDLKNSFTERRISPPDLSNENYRRSVKDEILKDEKIISKNYINTLSSKIEDNLLEITASPWNQFRLDKKDIVSKQKIVKSAIKKLTQYNNQSAKLSSDDSGKTSVSSKYKVITYEEVINEYEKLKGEGLIDNNSSSENIDLELLENLSKTLEEEVNKKKQIAEESSTESFENFELREKHLKDLQKKCLSISGDKEFSNPQILEEIVELLRGHSEDYLNYYIKKTDIIEKITSDVKDADRFYLIITSSRKACERCSHIVEEISKMVCDKINLSEDDKPLKLLYASPEPFLSSEKICEEKKNLSDEEFDTAKVINVRRQPVYTKLCNKADEIFVDNEKQFSTPERKKNVDQKSITSPGFYNLPLTQTPEGERSILGRINDSTATPDTKNNSQEKLPEPKSLITIFDNLDISQSSERVDFILDASLIVEDSKKSNDKIPTASPNKPLIDKKDPQKNR
jgi:hypothetical protein